VTFYVADCGNGGLCSSWVPSNQVIPYSPIIAPEVTATASGTTINYTWTAKSNGVPGTLQVCIAGACTDYTVPGVGGYSGSSSATYGNSQTETITAQLTNTEGQSSVTESASATTAPAPAPPPPPVNPSVSVSMGGVLKATSGSCVTLTCYDFNVSVTNFPAGTALSYTCAESSGVFYGPSSAVVSGSTTTNGSGGGNFVTDCVHAKDGEKVTINVSGGGKSASGSVAT
jgi:hypothetical protein